MLRIAGLSKVMDVVLVQAISCSVEVSTVAKALRWVSKLRTCVINIEAAKLTSWMWVDWQNILIVSVRRDSTLS